MNKNLHHDDPSSTRVTTLYLAGPMSNLPELNFPAFHAEASRLRALGYTVVNPAEINCDINARWIDCMCVDIPQLIECDGVALLPGWKTSKGATIESSTQTKADEIVTQLVKTLEGLQITAIQTQQAPEAAMSLWLVSQEMPPKFTADRDCTLKSHDEFKASIRYEHHALDIVEIQEHIRAGKRPIQLAMTWDSRVSFVLTSGGNLKKLEFLSATLTEQFVDDFDGNFTIATAEISQLISALIETLGGAMAA